MTFDYLGGREHVLSRIFNSPGKTKFFNPANDNEMGSAVTKALDKALCDAVMNEDMTVFRMLLARRQNSADALNNAYVLSIGFERKDFELELNHLAMRLDGSGDAIKLATRKYGILLRDIVKGEFHGVRVGLHSHENRLDPSKFDDIFFKQAILENHVDIARLLHAAGANIVNVMADTAFMDKVNRMDGVSREAKAVISELLPDFDRKIQPTIEPAL